MFPETVPLLLLIKSLLLTCRYPPILDISQVAITLDYRQRLRRQARRQGSYFKNTPVHMLWVRLRKGVGFLFFFSQLLLFYELYTANDTRHFAGKGLMLARLEAGAQRTLEGVGSRPSLGRLVNLGGPL